MAQSLWYIFTPKLLFDKYSELRHLYNFIKLFWISPAEKCNLVLNPAKHLTSDVLGKWILEANFACWRQKSLPFFSFEFVMFASLNFWSWMSQKLLLCLHTAFVVYVLLSYVLLIISSSYNYTDLFNFIFQFVKICAVSLMIQMAIPAVPISETE